MHNVQQSGDLMLDLVSPTTFSELVSLTCTPDDFMSSGTDLSWIYQLAKRSLDVCGALIGLMLFAFLLPFVALLILCEDGGPIFYRQTRIGHRGRPFTIYKLRSMMVNADAYLAQHPELLDRWQKNGKLHADPRITRIGNFLRRSSIDELPQLFNVLRGEMSLVGPRAIQPSELAAFQELADLRQMVKPGLTGLWQVSGRSTTDYEQRCVLDCTYVMECSFWTDMQILLKTLPVVFHRTGAY
ncbi:MAG TPA: sugar transferase [Ktedonobacteraceae bacterium]|nr:sugar transferase [Ktedonobacteraceae bacterium]